MKFNWFENASASSKFIIAIATMIGFMAIGIIVSVALAFPFFGADVKQFFRGDIHNIYLLKFLQVIQSIFLFVIPPFVLSYLFGKSPKKFLRIDQKPKFLFLLLSFCVILIIVPLINYLQWLNSHMQLPESLSNIEQWMKLTEEQAKQLTEKFLSVSTIGGLLVNIVVIAIVPAIGEELAFRGVFQSIFSAWFKNFHLGIWISAAFFSAFHFQFYGFLPRMLLGVLFGYMLLWTGSMWVPIFLHFINNLMGVIAYYLYFNGYIGKDFDTLGVEGSGHLFTVFSSAILTIALILLIKFAAKKQDLSSTV